MKKSPRMMIHLRLPRDLVRRIKTKAEREGRSITRYVERALERAVPKKGRRL